MNYDFAQQLKGYRERAGFTQQALADVMRVSRETISLWERGLVKRLKHDMVKALTEALGLAASEREYFFAAAGFGPSVNQDGISEASNPRPSNLHQLRAPTADFVGRESEIQQVIDTRKSDGSAVITTKSTSVVTAPIIGFFGMAGIGKSELAYMVASQLREDFPFQLEVNLLGSTDEPLKRTQILQKIIRAFGLIEQLPEDEADLIALYRSLLAQQPTLILADDAWNAEQVRPLMPPVGSVLLVTSRNRFSIPGMRPVELELLSGEESIDLLQANVNRLDDDEAKKLSQLCGLLPLALRIAAGLLASTPSLLTSRYLQDLANERGQLELLHDPDDPENPEVSVEATFNLSYRRLSQEEQVLLRRLGVFIGSFTREAAEMITVLPSKLLETLDRRCLVEYNLSLDRFSLHALVRLFALARLREAKEEQKAKLRHACYYLNIATQAEDLFLAGSKKSLEGLELFDQERLEIDSGWRWAREQPTSTMIDGLIMDYADAVAYIGNLRYDIRHERIPQLEAHLDAAYRQKDRLAVNVALNNLGNAYFLLGDMQQALNHFHQQLFVAREVGDRRGEGNALGSLGTVHRLLGDVDSAIDYEHQALIIFRTIHDHLGEMSTLGQLGAAYHLKGDVRKSVDLYQQQLIKAQEFADRSNEGAAISNIAASFLTLGDPNMAIRYYEQALTIFREIGDQWSEGKTLDALGSAYAFSNDLQKSVDYHEQSLVIARKSGDRVGETMALANLGAAAVIRGDLTHARDLYYQSLRISEAIGSQAIQAEILIGIAALAAEQGNTKDAHTYYEQARTHLQKLGNRKAESECCWKWGKLYEQEGDLTSAIQLMQIHVDFLRSIDHCEVEQYAAYVEKLGTGSIFDEGQAGRT